MSLEKSLKEISGLLNKQTEAYKREVINKDELSNLTLNHFNYIYAIEQLDNPTFSDLAETLDVTKASVSTMVNKLIKEGYVYKEQSSEDGRVYHLYLSGKGRGIVEAENKAFSDFINLIKEELDRDEFEKLQLF